MKKEIYFAFNQLLDSDGTVEYKINLSENVDEIIKINSDNHEINRNLLMYCPSQYISYYSVVGYFECNHGLKYYKNNYIDVNDYFINRYLNNEFVKITSVSLVH